jgi:hypothetical protein
VGKTGERRALAGDTPEPVAAVRLLTAGHQAEVPADGLAVAEAARVVHERGHRLGVRARPGDGPQQGDGRRAAGPVAAHGRQVFGRQVEQEVTFSAATVSKKSRSARGSSRERSLKTSGFLTIPFTH